MFAQSVVKSTCALILRMVVVILLVVVTVVALSNSALSASVPRKYAGIVVDAKTGKTLYASAADSLRYPASVTKVMTLYVLFQELEAGRMSLSTRMRVSKHASRAVPTKLGLKSGSTIKVEDAIKSLVTLSANDMSRVIAEHISGTESAFAVRMTKTARALGMARTTYKNASGLPDSGQVTTVRDQSKLGIAVFQHFPKYYKYFQTRSFKYKGRTYGNHNRLLGTVAGVDGLKTGYIRAAGYNLLTAARKDGRHVVVVGFGFNSGAARNAKVTSLVKKYFRKGRSGSYYKTAMIPRPRSSGHTRVATTPPRPATLASFRVAALQGRSQVSPSAPTPLIAKSATPVQIASASLIAPIPLERPINLLSSPAAQAVNLVASAPPPTPIENRPPVVGAWMSDTLKLDTRSGSKGPIPPAAIGQTAQNQTIDLMTSGAVGEVKTDPDAPSWIIQIGAAPSHNGAESLLSDASTRIATLTDYRHYVEKFEKDGRTFYRARIAGFVGREQASSMCSQVKQKDMSCLAVQG